jgi:hypothetical protein
LPANIRPGYKWLAVKNTQDYYAVALITVVKDLNYRPQIVEQTIGRDN